MQSNLPIPCRETCAVHTRRADDASVNAHAKCACAATLCHWANVRTMYVCPVRTSMFCGLELRLECDREYLLFRWRSQT